MSPVKAICGLRTECEQDLTHGHVGSDVYSATFLRRIVRTQWMKKAMTIMERMGSSTDAARTGAGSDID
jgi:hypothetical protein